MDIKTYTKPAKIVSPNWYCKRAIKILVTNEHQRHYQQIPQLTSKLQCPSMTFKSICLDLNYFLNISFPNLLKTGKNTRHPKKLEMD